MRRWHRRSLVLLIPLLAIGIVRASDDESIPFAVGQRWEYVTRPQDAGSTLVVVKIDRDRVHGHIVSVHVSGLHVKNPHCPDGITDTAEHMPFAESALRRSVTRLVAAKVRRPAFREGYQLWRSAFEEGNAGFYTITVAEAAQVMEDSLLSAR